MSTIRNIFLNRKGNAVIAVLVILSLTMCACSIVVAADKTKESKVEQQNQSTIKTGSGERYQTTVERHTEGTLSAQDLHQVSLLTSRIVSHLNDAVTELIDQNPEAAKQEIDNTRKLTKVVKELLPVTTVTTYVNDAGGKEEIKPSGGITGQT